MAPVSVMSREDLEGWLGLAKEPSLEGTGGAAKDLHAALAARGALFPQELGRAAKLLPAQVEQALGELIAAGALSCDGFAALRWLMVPPARRRGAMPTMGRWSLFRRDLPPAPGAEGTARRLLRRWGVLFRRMLDRERAPLAWRDLARACRTLEARGEIRGGRFVAGPSGEQYALPEAVSLLRAVRKRGWVAPATVSAADPLNLRGILTPDERVPVSSRGRVEVG
jgi:ATP-dependent Lhr-like helicase